MLILSRRKDESLLVGDDIKIKVLDVKGNQVRIGIAAPCNVSVHREEIYNRIRKEREEQAKDGNFLKEVV